MSMLRSRWAAIGAAVAVSLGAGGIGLVSATSPSGASTFVPVTPCRVIDTRPDFQVGPKSSPLGPAETYDVATTGSAGECSAVPTSATGVVLNVTATDASAPTFLTIWETGRERPNASSLNPTPGQPPAPNAVTTGIDGAGEFSIYNLQGTVHVLADIVGYYTDHHHDDRYYTKAQSDGRFLTPSEGDERFAPAPPVGVAKPDPLSFVPEIDQGWSFAGAWEHASGPSGCLVAPVDLPVGSEIADITITYRATVLAPVELVINSTRTSAGPFSTPTYRQRHLVAETDLPSSLSSIAAVTVADDPTVSYGGLAAVPLPGDGWTTYAAVCTSASLTVYSIEVSAS